MKARTKTTRWLLIALLLGFVAVAGVTFLRHGPTTLAQASHTLPAPAALQQPDTAPLVATGGRQPLYVPTYGGADERSVSDAHSNSQQTPATAHSDTPANTSTGTSSNNPPAYSASVASNTPAQSNHPAASNTSQSPQNPANGYAYNGYAPLDCELPAGCGVPGSADSVGRQISVTSGGVAVVHDSQDSNPDNDSSPPTAGNPPPGNNQNSTPPGQPDPPATHVASAPELDPATLAGAITLLLGSLALLRSRRARATG